MPAPTQATIDAVLRHTDTAFDQSRENLFALLRIPSISAQPAHKPDIQRAAEWWRDQLAGLGFRADIRPTAGHPVVVGHFDGPADYEGPHILFYAHYDVQPVDPLELWHSPPFEPQLVDGPHGKRFVARGAVDDKGQSMMFLEAMRAWHTAGGGIPARITVLIEGEEEVGSVSLWDYVQNRKEKLKADALLVSDTAMLSKGVPSITYGLRGLNYYQIELTGPVRDLHSGVYGGAVPNPLTVLTELFAKLHDKNFRIAVPGFYDDVAKVSAAERRALNKLPWKKKDFERAVGAPAYFGEKGFTTIERLWIRPTLELNGIWGGYQGEGAKTVIPSKAFAKFSTRLVPNQHPQKIAKLVEAHIRKLLPKTVHCKFEVLSTGKPWVAAYQAPIFQVAQGALQKGFGRKAVFIREGGSIPFVTQMHDTFDVPCVLIGFGLPDENAHAPDEHILLENYFGGIKAMAHFYEDLASS